MLPVLFIVLLLVSFVALPWFVGVLICRKPRPHSLIVLGGAIVAVVASLFLIEPWSLLDLVSSAIAILSMLLVAASAELTFRQLWPRHGETFVCGAILAATVCCFLLGLASAL